jgi:hypothetical protein
MKYPIRRENESENARIGTRRSNPRARAVNFFISFLLTPFIIAKNMPGRLDSFSGRDRRPAVSKTGQVSSGTGLGRRN